MKKRSYKWINPICSCLNCKHNSHNVCVREGASKVVGWKCPHFAPPVVKCQSNVPIKNLIDPKSL